MEEEQKAKEELKELAREILESLKEKDISIWQAREALKFVSQQLEWQKIK